MSQTGIMTSKAMPGAGDVANGVGGFQYSHPIVQLYDNPYPLLDRFQLAKLSERIGRPIKTQITRGISNMPGKDKLVTHFLTMESMGTIRRDNMVPMIEALLREAEDAKRVPLNLGPEESELSAQPTAPNPEVMLVGQMDNTELKAYAKKLGVAVLPREKRRTIVDKVFAALGVSV